MTSYTTVNGIGFGAVSISGAAPGVAVTASASAQSVTLVPSVDGSFVMVGYGDQDDGSAAANYPLIQLYGGAIGSAKGAAGYANDVTPDSNSFSFTGGGGSPVSVGVVFSPKAVPAVRGTILILK